MKKFDVLIAGAGPAGSFLAYSLAKKGISVGLFERKKLPRYKACGGGITQKSLAVLDFDISPVIHAAPQVAAISLRGKDTKLIRPPKPVAWTVMRDSFDHFLVEKACCAGAELLEEQPISRLEENGSVRAGQDVFAAEVVVGADGVLSTIAQQSGIRKDLHASVAVESEVYVSDAVLAEYQNTAVFDFAAVPWGYGWIFPKKDHLSVGLCSMRPRAIGLKTRLGEFIDYHLGKGQPKELVQKGHLIPPGDATQSFSRSNILLVGDAAGLTDPFTGEGIFYALKSAQIASISIEKYVGGKEKDLTGYDVQVREAFYDDFLWARKAAGVIYSQPYLSHKLLVGNSHVANGFVRVLAGDEGYQHFIKNSLASVGSLLKGFRQNN